MSNKLVNIELRATTISDEQQLVFGWASVVAEPDGTPVVDHEGHIIEVSELENAVYMFVRCGGMASEMHQNMYQGCLIESMVFTEQKIAALGLPVGTLPYGWWVGFYVYDENVFKKIKNGEYKMLSIAGKAYSEDVD